MMMMNMINFKIDNPKEQRISFPSKEDIDLIEAKISLYDHDEMVLVEDWNGSCWRMFFEDVVKPNAIKRDLDPWDCFAYLVGKMFG